MANAINWFEIPATNFTRAKDFYSNILSTELAVMEIMDIQMAMFNSSDSEVGGAICKSEGHTPSQEGTVPYLNGGEDLSSVLDRVESAGGKVLVPKTKISDEIGFFAQFLDTEGNRIALHSAG